MDEQAHSWAEKFSVVFFVNDSGSNKLCIWDTATNQSNIMHTHGVGKWENTAVVNKVAIAGKKGADSKLAILGDGTPTNPTNGLKVDGTENLTNVDTGTRIEDISTRKIHHYDDSGLFFQKGNTPSSVSGVAYAPFDSVYESLNPLTTVAKQRFVHWFEGRTLNTGNDGRWQYTDYLSSNHTGSGMVDEVDGGFKLVGNSSGGSSQNTLIAFDDKKPFSNTGSVVIWVAKMTATGTNKQGGWGMCGTMPNYWLNGMKINIATGGTAIDFYTMNNSTENNSGSTDLNSSLSPSDWQTYKLEQLSSSAKCYINGVEEAVRTTYLSSTAMQPFVYSKYDNSAVQVKYCEAYNT